MKNLYWSLIACMMTGSVFAQDLAKGTVFNDLNGNGKQDRKENGIEGVAISNGKDVVLTNNKGKYEIPVQNDNIIFVIKPSGYELPVDQDNHPKFYYIHKPNGSPQLKYQGVAPTGPLPKAIDFALKAKPESNQFSAFVFGDPQAYTEEEIQYFSKGLIDEAKERKGPLFGISLGDLVGDNLSLHPSYKTAVGKMGLPWFNVMGNHDMNYDVTQDSLADEGFERTFGPNNYSFNVGNAHFIVLDNIIYPHPETGKSYQGGLRADQLKFIENDLKFVPKDKLVVLAFHIPLNPENNKSFRKEDRKRLFELLKDYPNTLSLSAHTHYQQQNFYTQEHDWLGAKPHHEYNVGTTSGDWYSGQLNEKGVPASTMRDGTPKGYAILNINGNQYNFDYKVAGKADNYTIGVFGPSVVKEKYAGRYPIYANFFLGSATDKVTFRIDQGAWKNMEKAEGFDPAYMKEILAFDGAEKFIQGRRPSDPSNSAHIWKLNLPKLKAGKHTVEIQAIDMFGRTHNATKEIDVIN